MIYFFRNSIKTFLVLGLCASMNGQNNTEVNYYNLFDQEVGVANTALYQGVVYTEKYRTINGNTQYYKTRDFLKGSVCYEGQCYYDLNLKYDVYEDQVLLKLIGKAGGGTVQLFKDKIESFQINGSDFVKLEEKNAPSLNKYGFYSVALKSPTFTLYTKYNKKSFDRKDRSSVYYEFLDGPSEHVLLYDKKYYIVNTKKDNIMVFPELKKEIDKFYNLARGLRKSNPDGFQVSLMKRIEILLSQPNNPSK